MRISSLQEVVKHINRLHLIDQNDGAAATRLILYVSLPLNSLL